jgi:hypothetical protein
MIAADVDAKLSARRADMISRRISWLLRPAGVAAIVTAVIGMALPAPADYQHAADARDIISVHALP